MIDIDILASRYQKAAGKKPEGVWTGPGRVNLIGEHTDYNDGFVLPFALEKKAVVAAGRRTDNKLLIVSVDFDQQVEIDIADLKPGSPGWTSYLAGVVWALREAGHQVTGTNLVLTSDVPLGAGLSSSAAIECATMTALCDLYQLDIEPMQRAKLARVAENKYVGAPTGLLDQAASILCQDNNALFLDCRSLDYQQVQLPLADYNLEILVLDTHTPHSHVAGEYASRRESCEKAAKVLGIEALRDVTDLPEALAKLSDPVMIKRVRHVVTENNRVLQAVELARKNQIVGLGELMNASHTSMRDDFEITVPTVDLAVTVAQQNGALGARMTGGGFGGCVIALCEIGTGEQIGNKINQAFTEASFEAPTWFIAKPSAGARRLR